MAEIRLEQLRHVYSQGTPFEKVALDCINLTIPSNQLLVLLGHTGSGKSTLVQHLNGLLKPTSGSVLLDGQDIHRSKQALHETRFQVGLVMQYPEYQLFEETVYKDIAFGPSNMGLKGSELEEHVRLGANFAGVSEELFDKSPLDLSGGQKRRVAIAGVLAMKPGILILDEPTAGLDPAGCDDILANVKRYKEETGSTVILISHNMNAAAAIAERIVVVCKGNIALDGTPDEVFARARELREMGLQIPDATTVRLLLRDKGFAMPDGISTAQELVDAVMALKGGKN
ncbi:MAG: energy-coupling factor transporter ATPase [Clostridiales bacterium]|nr:energy-coupling factor transporter ATPase [Candidatus Apopatocola equi]